MTTHHTEPAVDLLPCPFCGEMPKSHLFHGDFGGMQIDCITPNCPASPITTGNSLGDPLIAFNAWNRRAAIGGLKAIPGVSILGAHDGTLPDAVYDALTAATDPDFILAAIADVHDMDATLTDYAAAVSRAIRAAMKEPTP